MTEPKLDIHFDGRSGDYWLKIGARFVRLDGRNVKLHAVAAGLDIDAADKCGLKIGDRLLVRAQIDRHIDYAGALAGHSVGAFKTPGGASVLVTVAPDFRLAGSGKGDWQCLDRFIDGMLGAEQSRFFYLWLKFARQSLLTGDFRPGQLMVFAGPARCGKSFMQSVVTAALGGRCACPFRYMIGETSFNSDLGGAEHLAIEDVNASTDIRSRRKFGASIKEFTVCSELSIHGKGKAAISLPVFHRLTLSVNDEPENLMIVPPLDASLADKIMLLKCAPASEFLSDDRRKNQAMLARELPAMLADIDGMPCPPKMRCPRFGVLAFHNPELLEILTQTEPHQRLLDLIDQILFNGRSNEWSGSSDQLEMELRKSAFCWAVEKLLYFSGACGTYLGRLKSKHPERIECRRHHGKNFWRINPPQ